MYTINYNTYCLKTILFKECCIYFKTIIIILFNIGIRKYIKCKCIEYLKAKVIIIRIIDCMIKYINETLLR